MHWYLPGFSRCYQSLLSMDYAISMGHGMAQRLHVLAEARRAGCRSENRVCGPTALSFRSAIGPSKLLQALLTGIHERGETVLRNKLACTRGGARRVRRKDVLRELRRGDIARVDAVLHHRADPRLRGCSFALRRCRGKIRRSFGEDRVSGAVASLSVLGGAGDCSKGAGLTASAHNYQQLRRPEPATELTDYR